jgi:MFS superfamily sulfate permease-like transporter
VSALKHLWRSDRPEFVVAIAAIVGVLGEGLLRGVMIGAIISLVLLIRRASRPHVAFLGRIPGTRRFSDRERHPDNELIPGVLIFRPESGLMYFNMDHVRDRIVDRVRAETAAPRLVVLDLSAAPRVDMHSAQMLGSLADELTATGIRVQAVEARSSVRDRLHSEGVDDNLGGINRPSLLRENGTPAWFDEALPRESIVRGVLMITVALYVARARSYVALP